MTGAFRVLCVVGARPNFMKTVPVLRALASRGGAFAPVLVHTGQHYDDAMSTVFFEELGVGRPDHMLDVGSGSHATQTARIMERIEPVLEAERPDMILVPGDVNSTIASALVASKMGIPIGHIEAGLRSFDRTMPEEINRVLTDQLSDLLFIHSPEARDNLLREGIAPDAIHAVGNTMIDTLVAMRPRVDDLAIAAHLGLAHGAYLVVTLHRPALVDGPLLCDAIAGLNAISREIPIVFPCHPRTRARMDAEGITIDESAVRVLEPMGYLDFLSLLSSSGGVLTDSGGVQEETSFLGVPCFTLRDNTERPVTCDVGTNVLLGLRPDRIAEVPSLLAAHRSRPHRIPAGWDGFAAERVVDVIESYVDAERVERAA